MATAVGTRDWGTVDFYAVLEVAPDAPPPEIGRAYRDLAKRYHPDTGATEEDAERFRAVAAAYAVLSNPRLRADYDRVRPGVGVVGDGTRASEGVRSGLRTDGPPPMFRAARPRRGWTRARAWLAVAGGLAVTLLGLASVALLVALHGEPPADAASATARDLTLGLVALKLLIGGPVFVVVGARRLRVAR